MTAKQRILRVIDALPDDVTLQQAIDRLGDELRGVVNGTSLEQKRGAADRYPLRGTVTRYSDPFEPAVPSEDWESAT